MLNSRSCRLFARLSLYIFLAGLILLTPNPSSAAPAAAPGAFGKLIPPNITTQPTNPILRWGNSSGAQGYNYCYDEIPNNTCDTSWVSTTSHSVVLSGLASGHTYYWQVRAYSMFPSGSTEADGGTWWSFTVDSNVPTTFFKTAPVYGAGDQPGNTSLAWTASSPVSSYEYCLDAETVNNSTCDSGWINNGTSTTVTLDNLLGSTNYVWQIRAVYSGHSYEADGGVWSAFVTRAAGTQTVTNNNSDGPGSLAQTVREAVNGDVINFAGDYNIDLPGTLTINETLTISAGIWYSITISGDPDHDGTGNFRLFTIGSTGNVDFDHLTLAYGYDSVYGGAVKNDGQFTASDCRFENNKSGSIGGAIYNFNTASISRSTFSQNSAMVNGGGAIKNDGNLTVEWSTFTGNSAPMASTGDGGAIYNMGNASISSSTFVNNTSALAGGAVYLENYNAGTHLTITNSTFFNNSSSMGGGIYLQNGIGLMENSTVVGNTASSSGGGISVSSPSGNSTLTLQDSIVASNTGYQNCIINPIDSVNLVDGGGNLTYGDTFPICPGTNADPQLGSLKNNGGPVQTMAPALGSPAIDAASTVSCEPRDARGVLRPQGAHCDIGAVEVITISGSTGIGGVTLSYNDGLAETATSASNGHYEFEIPYNWSGTVTPSKANKVFTPDHRSYANIEASQIDQNYLDLKFIFLPLIIR